jgi:hypothetical protein
LFERTARGSYSYREIDRGKKEVAFMKKIVNYLKIVSLALALLFVIQGCGLHAGFHVGSTDQPGTTTAQSMTPDEGGSQGGF